MALTLRSNGSGATNLVNSSWWNDYFNLLTGSMPDQPVSLVSNLTMKSSLSTAATGTQTTTLIVGGSMGVGVYQYCYTWAMSDGGESLPSPSVSVTTDSTHKSLTYSGLQAGPTGTTKRNIYRTQVGGSIFYYLTSISDNTTTTYADGAADTVLTLTQTAPIHSTFGGAVFFKDASGTTHLTITPDGSFIGAGGVTTLGNTTINNALTLGNNGSISFKDSGGTSRLMLTLLATDGDAHAYTTPANGNFKISKSDASGDIAIFNNSKITFLMDLSFTGRLGVSAVGDILDGSGYDTFLKARGGGNLIHFQYNSDGTPTEMGNIGSTGLLVSGGRFGASNTGDIIDGAGSTTYIKSRGSGTTVNFQNNSDSSGSNMLSLGTDSVQVNSFFGIRTFGGTKLVEFKNDGSMNLKGAYYYGQGTSGFDSFDVAEVFVADADYAFGTVVCPSDITTAFPTDILTYNPHVTKCTHDACSLCMVISKAPGSVAGKINSSSFDGFDNTQPFSLPAALVGRIYAKTAYSIAGQSYVTSDGRGGVRAVVPGEKAFAIGITIAPSNNGLVPIILRNMHVSL